MGLLKKVLWAITVVLFIGCSQSGSNQNTRQKKKWAIVLHGGAGVISRDMPDSIKQAYRNDLGHALDIGVKMLKNGDEAADVVEHVINYMEDNPKFNAGKGAVFTHEGEHELDAAIMIGNTRQAGTVTGVKTVKNPISLARLVMEKSKHVMFAGAGAEAFADKMGVDRVNQQYFYTERRYKQWKRALQEDQKDAQSSALPPKDPAVFYDYNKFGTVGCVVLDQHGQLVAGTSTGGLTDKMYGRVGDVPVIGAGTYASDVVAVSMTGIGEKIMKAVSGHTVSAYMKYKPAPLKEAGDYLLNDVLDPNVAGMIAVDKYGNTYMNMNTQGMFRATADSKGTHKVAIWEE
ncbi:MAG TPA: isoaspartyl peptidase/L-asparaginase [Balneolaceae bacterium]|nr:isoaspartyl peptidase/L-asparaginase [Balneolaceae bacterium]